MLQVTCNSFKVWIYSSIHKPLSEIRVIYTNPLIRVCDIVQHSRMNKQYNTRSFKLGCKMNETNVNNNKQQRQLLTL